MIQRNITHTENVMKAKNEEELTEIKTGINVTD